MLNIVANTKRQFHALLGAQAKLADSIFDSLCCGPRNNAVYLVLDHYGDVGHSIHFVCTGDKLNFESQMCNTCTQHGDAWIVTKVIRNINVLIYFEHTDDINTYAVDNKVFLMLYQGEIRVMYDAIKEANRSINFSIFMYHGSKTISTEFEKLNVRKPRIVIERSA